MQINNDGFKNNEVQDGELVYPWIDRRLLSEMLPAALDVIKHDVIRGANEDVLIKNATMVLKAGLASVKAVTQPVSSTEASAWGVIKIASDNLEQA